ncbi:MAG: chromosome segregation protein SMC [Gammaproteobacteria bacterium]
MRLSKIKLAGFKSFVDPTTIHFPSNLMGIVGPNGCGKSNVIDAVRWVLGETSAKYLRGDSMADVIFNGSSARKPVGTAAIELIFDNSAGDVGGQYAGYAEISIRRVVARDGTSNYFLNNTRCRRKDITSLFLGTGLGPRSYAIIEQGMISRLIEAKPEEMRVYLEEAAGISKYKDRRRETENRIRHTRDNLSRLDDLREEVDKQIKHLQRQARTAERFKELKQRQRLLEAELLALRLADLEAEESRQKNVLGERETALQAAIARLRETEAEIEKTREQHSARSEALNEVQGRFYKIGAEIARLEQAIQHARELRQRQQSDLEQAERALSELSQTIDRDEGQIQHLDKSLEELGPGLEAARAAEISSMEALSSAEQGMQSWQQRWEAFNQEAGTANRAADVERARIEQIETQMRRLVDRRERTAAEISRLTGQLEGDEIERFDREASLAGETAAELDARMGVVRSEIERLREQDEAAASALHTTRGNLQQARGELASLEALQEAALGRRGGSVADWLEGRGLQDRPRLAEKLTVDTGWERAVETVLGSYLEAVCVDGLDVIAGALNDLTHGAVSFLDADLGEHGSAPHTDLLAKRVKGPPALAHLLSGVRAVEDLPRALAVRRLLGPGESVVTQDGIWMGAGWLRINRPEENESGVLRREQEIRKQRQVTEQLLADAEAGEAAHEQIKIRLRALEQDRDNLQGEINQAHRLHGDLRGQLGSARQRLEQARTQLDQFKVEDGEVTTQFQEAEGSLRSSRAQLEASIGQMSVFEAQRGELESQREQLRAVLDQARERAQAERAAAHEIAIKVESRRSSRESAEVALERLRAQIAQHKQRRDELRSQLASGEAPVQQQQGKLAEFLEHRIAVESALSEARDAVHGAEAQLRQLQEHRQLRDRQAEEVRVTLEELRLSTRETSVRRETIAEQFKATGFELAPLREAIADDASIPVCEENLTKLTSRIERLGPINLASIDELKEQEERKAYLDAQNQDLTDALTTLENAIRRIDKETRTRFKETFDKVNDGLKQFFPRLFGGGHGYLELSGDDMLDAGVTVMARPPGKRISSIHLLSGGEKALTAVALVFSIFNLNPAPFCMLDEVDAPLDDANVGRFCEIVKEMAERVQFIVITHNKMTMEMTHQLAGVTMHEPGVSRLVAVDLDEAVQMAAM